MQTPQLMKDNEIYNGNSEYKKKYGTDTTPNEKYHNFGIIVKHYHDGEIGTDNFVEGYKFYVISNGDLYTNHMLYKIRTSAFNAAYNNIESGHIPEVPAERDFPSKNKKFKCPDCGHIHGNER